MWRAKVGLTVLGGILCEAIVWGAVVQVGFIQG